MRRNYGKDKKDECDQEKEKKMNLNDSLQAYVTKQLNEDSEERLNKWLDKLDYYKQLREIADEYSRELDMCKDDWFSWNKETKETFLNTTAEIAEKYNIPESKARKMFRQAAAVSEIPKFRLPDFEEEGRRFLASRGLLPKHERDTKYSRDELKSLQRAALAGVDGNSAIKTLTKYEFQEFISQLNKLSAKEKYILRLQLNPSVQNKPTLTKDSRVYTALNKIKTQCNHQQLNYIYQLLDRVDNK